MYLRADQLDVLRAGSAAAGPSWNALVSTARQLLDVVLFSQEHMTSLQELALSSLPPVSSETEGQEQKADDAEAHEPDDAKATKKAYRHAKYAALLPEVRCQHCVTCRI